MLENFNLPTIKFAATILAWLYAFWCLYVAFMGFYRAHLSGRLNGVSKILAYPIVLFCLFVDFVFQYTVFTFVFMDLPKAGEHLVSLRLRRYVAGADGWRKDTANYICDNLLDMFDPSGNHC